MSSRRIIFLTNSPYLGGTARILQSWLLLGRERGIQGSAVLQKHGDLSRWCEANELSAVVDPMPWPSRWKPWDSAFHACRVAQFARRQEAELIHCNEHDLYPFAVLLKRFLNRPIVCHVRFKLSRGFTEWAFGGRRAPDALLWTSHQQKSDSADAIAGLVPEARQHVVRLGVDLTRFGLLPQLREQTRKKWDVRDDEILIATPSPIRVRKRVHEFLRMIARLADRCEKVVGIVAGGAVPGEESYRDEIVRQIASTNLGRRLQWVGYLEPVEPLYHAADIVVSTSEYETFGNSVCEAMACRKPVVAYRGGSVHEVVGEGGVIVDTGDLDALSAATERLLLDETMRRELGQKARDRVAREFDAAKSFERLQEIYASILG